MNSLSKPSSGKKPSRGKKRRLGLAADVTILDKVGNEHIRGSWENRDIGHKIEETRKPWLGKEGVRQLKVCRGIIRGRAENTCEESTV